ncbi:MULTISPECIES: hypothetical protein [Paenibacillus]|uniref:hypothetical protein n=1 Tax=Paenibacillus TaxID=44249 RepID=UPI00129D242C|nr:MULTISPECIES: hypothetical protein [Paenibacillus]MBY0217398.1 hypothetical protein [Paenibacillus illinoisensis]
MDTDDNSLNSFQELIETPKPMRPSVKSKLTTHRIVGIAMVILPLVLIVHLVYISWD